MADTYYYIALLHIAFIIVDTYHIELYLVKQISIISKKD